MKHIIYITLILSINISLSFAQNENELKKANTYLEQKGEIYFSFYYDNSINLLELTKIISIDNITNNKIYAYANKREFEIFLLQNIDFTVLQHPGDIELTMFDASKDIWDFDTYPTYEEFESMMYSFGINYPELCEIIQVGTTVNGRKLLFAKISDNINIREAEPRFMYTGTIHGDETTGYITLLRLINYLLENYETDIEVKNLVDKTEIWIMPLENPDGTYYGGNHTIANSRRNNANGFDLNRNYPSPVSGEYPNGTRQPETIAMMSFADSISFTMSANMHGGIELLNYPYDSWLSSTKKHADHDWFHYISREYVDTVHLYSPSNYMRARDNGVTHGGDWYVVYGSRQDYHTYYALCREITFELSNTKRLPADQLHSHWNWNYRSLLNYIKESHYGIRGIVTDACTNQPIIAKVNIDMHDADNSHIYSWMPLGDFYRPIKGGTYTVTWSAPGYETYSQEITVNDKEYVYVEVSLNPLSPISNFVANNTWSCKSLIEFTNLSEASASSSYLWNFGDGNSSTEINPVHVYSTSGVYTVSLTTINACTGNDTIVKTDYLVLNLPEAPTALSASHCGKGNVTIGVNGNGTMLWYNNITDDNHMHEGYNYTTPLLTNTTSYFVESYIDGTTYIGGNYDLDTNGAFFNSNSVHYLEFNCNQKVILKSVEVNASFAGERLIQLRNSSGITLQSKHVYINEGISRIDINFIVEQGIGYQLACQTYPGLWRNDSGCDYPYNIDGIITINKSSAGSNPTGFYYYFYNWEIEEIGCTSGRTEVKAIINPLPNAFAGNDSSICMGETISLLASGGNSYLWSNGLGTNPLIYVSPNQNTSYYVTVTNNYNCTKTAEVTINVNENPIVEAVSNQVINIGETASLSCTVSQGSGNYSYNWQPDSLLINNLIQNPETIELNNATNFIVIVTDNTTNCSSADTTTVFVLGGALNLSLSSSNSSICIGNDVQLNALVSGGSGNYQYQWASLPAGFNSSIQNPIVNPSINTNYYVTVSDGESSTNSYITIVVKPIPIINLGNDTIICFNSNITLNANNGTSYLWSNGHTGQINDVTINNETTYSVTVTNSFNCTNSDSIKIDVFPQIIHSISNSQTICIGDEAVLIATGGIYYEWSNLAGNTDTIIVAPTTNTKYYVTISDTNNCFIIDSVTINVNKYPIANFSYNTNMLNIVFINSSQYASSYIWSFGDGGISNQANPNYNYANEGIYDVKLIAKNSCGNDTIINSVEINLTNIYLLDNNNIIVFPNPTYNELTVNTNNENTGIYSIEIYNIQGIKIQNIESNKAETIINTSELPSGVYQLKIIGNSYNGNIKFVKLKQ